MAAARVFLMGRDDAATIGDFVNIGTDTDISIQELAGLIVEVIDYRGGMVFDPTKPDGAHRKLLDVSNLAGLGWKAKIGLTEDLKKTYADFIIREKEKTLKG